MPSPETQDGRPFKYHLYACKHCPKTKSFVFPDPPPKEFFWGPPRTNSYCRVGMTVGHRMQLVEEK